MAKRILRDCKLYLGGYDLSGDANELGLEYAAEVKDATTFASSGAREKVAGLPEFKASHKGLFNADVDAALFSKISLSGEVMSLFGQTGLAGEVGYIGKVLEAGYSPGGKIGDVFTFTVRIEGDGSLVRATLLATGSKSASGSGTAFNLGDVPADKKLYAALHVLAKSGTAPTLDVKIQSDDAEGFASPTDRIVFARMTDVGDLWATPVLGPITDSWWRANWAVGGSAGPAFAVVIAAGIL